MKTRETHARLAITRDERSEKHESSAGAKCDIPCYYGSGILMEILSAVDRVRFVLFSPTALLHTSIPIYILFYNEREDCPNISLNTGENRRLSRPDCHLDLALSRLSALSGKRDSGVVAIDRGSPHQKSPRMRWSRRAKHSRRRRMATAARVRPFSSV